MYFIHPQIPLCLISQYFQNSVPTISSATSLVQVTITSDLKYDSNLLSGLPASILGPLHTTVVYSQCSIQSETLKM